MDLLKYKPDKKIGDYVFSLHSVIGKGSSGMVYIGWNEKKKS